MPIQVLMSQLANQIAAGEVVERPASVVKELLENSLDADATHIEIDIERGGAKRIGIRDNGIGIAKKELALALARHATSKIDSLDDLESITSMGFRGEALASISSVSRLILTSRPAAQSEAWQAYAEGHELAVTLKPAAHPVGTTVDVLDLFYNTPARRKFMRTEKTEFIYIDEVIRRIALARFDVTFVLQHNRKTIRQYRAISQQSQYLRRLGGLCGAAFVKRALDVSWKHGDLAIHGWIANPAEGELPNIQYSYVNRRTIRDKLINHAIRQAYQEKLAVTYQPAFVLFLDVDPRQVDINVHPTKHEVRFHQARLVHDFIYQAVITILQKNVAPVLPIDEEDTGSRASGNRKASGHNYFSLPPGDASFLRVAQKPDGEPIHQPGNSAKYGKVAARPTVVAGAEGRLVLGEAGGDSDHDRRSSAVGNGSTSLYQQKAQNDIFDRQWGDNNTPHAGAAFKDKAPVSAGPIVADNPQSFGRVLTLVAPYYALIEPAGSLTLLSLQAAKRGLTERQLIPGTEQLRAQPLLIPLRMTMRDEETVALKRYQLLLQEMGITLQIHINQVILNAVPLLLRQQNLQNLIPDLLGYLIGETSVTHHQLAGWLARRLQHEEVVWNYSRAIQLVAELERFCPQWVKAPPDGLLVTLNFKAAIEALNHD